MAKAKDLTGKRFGRLIVLNRYKKNAKDRHATWSCKCDCGNFVNVSSNHLVDNSTLSCGCFGEEQNLKTINGLDVGFNRIYADYKRNAKKRKLAFELNIEQFQSLIKGNCYYCDASPRPHPRYPQYSYNGIDRKNSALGYSTENCVPCCSHCNFAKRDLSEEQFKQWVTNVYKHISRKLSDKTPGLLFDELFTTNTKLWIAQEKIMDSSLNDSERARYAEEAQKLNSKRNKLIRSIDTLLDFGEDTVSFKTYTDLKEQ